MRGGGLKKRASSFEIGNLEIVADIHFGYQPF